MTRRLDAWWLAIRPRTLPASVAPVLLGIAMAFGDGIGHWPSAVAALFAALFIQIGTNLANDYFDFRNGVDASDRKGPLRVTQSGLIAPEAVKRGFVLSFVAAVLVSIGVLVRVGWPAWVIGCLSILSGIFYTAGPRPLSHLGLGEIFVLIFFGPVAVAGTYYIQSFECTGAVLLMGLACGFLSTAILVINNLRDIDTDRRAGKRTLAVRFGRSFARREYIFCLLAAAAMPPCVYILTQEVPWTMASSLVIFFSVPLVETVFTSEDGAALNSVLAKTGIILLVFCLVFSLAWAL